MSGYREIRSQSEMNEFLRWCGEFHDGQLKELHWVNSAYVAADLMMSVHSRPYARLLVQRQYRSPSAVEMLLGDVIEVVLEPTDMIFGAAGEYYRDEAGRPVIQLTWEGAAIECRRLWYRDASEWMGKDTRFGAGAVLPDSGAS